MSPHIDPLSLSALRRAGPLLRQVHHLLNRVVSVSTDPVPADQVPRRFARIAARDRDTSATVDPLQKDDIERSKLLPPEERLQAVLAAVNTGVRIRWAALRARLPQASNQDIDRALREWLKDERADD